MTDVVASTVRSRMMARIKAKNTQPEIIVRKALHRAGYRFRLHGNQLPGKPDIVLPKYKTAIFVHGCFWHCHNCRKFKWPKTREEFWRKKLLGNVERDRKCIELLEKFGWTVKIVWECEVNEFENDVFTKGLTR